MNEIFERIDKTVKEKGIKKKELNDYLGLSHSTYNNWANGSNESYLKYIDKIAEYLEVSPNYLLRGTEVSSSYEVKHNEQEEQLLRLYRSLSVREAKLFIILMETYIKSTKITDCNGFI